MIELLFCLAPLIFSEEPPEPEYPYPKTQKKSILDVEQPLRKDNRGAYIYSTEKKTRKRPPIEGVQQPYRIGSDGSYYYDTTKSEKRPPIEGVEKPIKSDDEGGYYYSPKTNRKTTDHVIGEKPLRIEADGSYVYSSDEDVTQNTFYLRGGVYGPPDIRGSSNSSRGYRDIYTNSSQFVFGLEYDWKLMNEFYVKLGWGFTSAEGSGQFATDVGFAPKERFQFFIFPTTVSLGYKFQIWTVQYVTPYLEAGPGYFGFVENRSDGKSTRFGGAPTVTASAGLMISLTKLIGDTNLRSDYGVTQSWLDLQYKQVVGLDSRKDFSSNMITGGFALGF